MNQTQEITLQQLSILTNIATTHQGNVSIDLVQQKEQKYVLKSIKKNYITTEQQAQHLQNEKQALIQLNYPSINKLITTQKDEEHIYFILQFEEGIPLHRLLQNVGKLNQQFACFLMIQLLYTFEYLHGKGWIYRDLKASNVIITNDFKLKLIDFGFAKQIGMNQTNSFCGTLHSMPPEVVRNKETPYGYNFDYYSIGILFYEMLTGKAPFGYEENELINKILVGISDEQLQLIENAQIKQLIKHQLSLDISERLNCSQALQLIPFFDKSEIKRFIENDLPNNIYMNDYYEEEIYLYCTQFKFETEEEQQENEQMNI